MAKIPVGAGAGDLRVHPCQALILTRRQNVTAGCLNFAKSHFAIPDSGVACL